MDVGWLPSYGAFLTAQLGNFTLGMCGPRSLDELPTIRRALKTRPSSVDALHRMGTLFLVVSPKVLVHFVAPFFYSDRDITFF